MIDALVDLLAGWEDRNGTMSCVMEDEWAALREEVRKACVYQSPRMLRNEMQTLRAAAAEQPRTANEGYEACQKLKELGYVWEGDEWKLRKCRSEGPRTVEPPTADQVKALAREAGYDDASLMERVDFINGLRHGELAHGIGLVLAGGEQG